MSYHHIGGSRRKPQWTWRQKKHQLYILKNREKDDRGKKDPQWTEQSNVCVIGVPVEEAKDIGAENIFEETMKNIPRVVHVH